MASCHALIVGVRYDTTGSFVIQLGRVAQILETPTFWERP